MQFEQITKEERVVLPRPSIDTGMGLERIAAVMQGEHDNYDIDLFRALIRASEDATGVRAEGKNRASHRVIADHLRASSFLIADGVLPSNEGRGYVLRRIMRRAMRHAQLLGAADPLMWRLVPALVREMGQAYPELVRGQALITETLKLEETRFRKTLARGLGLLADATETLDSGGHLDGATAFKLYDTYGFPLDLTQDALRQRGISVDLEGFNAAMARQKAEARASWAGSGEAATETVWFAVRENAGATEFLGYDTEQAEGIVLALVKDGAVAETAVAGETVGIVVNQTPFYGESGGQMGDTGTISGEGFSIEVTDTQKKGDGLFVHSGRVVKGTVTTGAAVELKVDHARRTRLRSNHSATHLSTRRCAKCWARMSRRKARSSRRSGCVSISRIPSRFRPEELERVERMANEIVVQNSPVTTRLMSVDDAIAEGAMALFGEKYGDEVRVVSMGTGIRAKRPESPIRSSSVAAPMFRYRRYRHWCGWSRRAQLRQAFAASRR